jgi:uncharacterized protein (DUF2164 family)
MKMPLPEPEKREALDSIQRYMSSEIDVDISEMQAELILGYFTKELAPFAYNKGIQEAQQFLLMKAEDLGGACFEEGLTYWKSSNRGSGAVRRKPSY